LAVDPGLPISYEVLDRGTPVYSSDGVQIGTVAHVVAAEDEDIFDGLVITEHRGRHGYRFVDTDDIDQMYERAVILKLDAEASASLHEPTPNPPVVIEDPTQPESRTLGHKLRRAWDYISGKY
jgi:uncharacterized protein YrrD